MFKYAKAILTIVLAVFISGCDKSKDAQVERPQARLVKSEIMQLKSASERRFIAGNIQADDTTKLSFAVSGTIEKLYFETGNHFEKGDVMAQLDTLPYKHQLKIAEGVLAEAQAALAGVEAEQNAKKQLLKSKDIGSVAYKDSLARSKAAQARVISAKARLDNAKRDYDKTKIVAPYNGVVVERLAEEYMDIRAGQVVYDVYDPKQLELEVLVPENLIHHAKPGQIYSVLIPSLPNVVLESRVKTVGEKATVANAFPVTLSILKSHPQVKPGMTGELVYTFKNPLFEKAFLVPISAFLPIDKMALTPDKYKLIDSSGKRMQAEVYVVDDKKLTVHKRIVEIGGLVNNRVLVYAGLKSGERVVTAGAAFLHEGQKIKLMEG